MEKVSNLKKSSYRKRSIRKAFALQKKTLLFSQFIIKYHFLYIFLFIDNVGQ